MNSVPELATKMEDNGEEKNDNAKTERKFMEIILYDDYNTHTAIKIARRIRYFSFRNL